MDKKTKAKKTIPDTICRVHRSGGYAVLSNCFVRSTNIGCDSIGLLGKINDLPPTWNFTIAGLVAICEDGETAIKSQLADEICSPLPYTTLRGQAFPRAVIQSKMLKANIYMVENVLENMAKVDNIKDFRRYFISSLYNEVLTYHFNEGCESRNIDEQIRRDLGYGIAV